MAETKYGKYIIKAPLETSDRYAYPSLSFRDDKPWSDWRNINYSMAYRCIAEPIVMAEEPHEHDFEQFLFFLGGDSTNIGDLQAEIELTLGREGEKHTITTASVVRIPAGLYHGPFNFKRIDKPMVFINVYLAPEYIRKA
jgi:mannose-6-phosphate isomerase-like protein (cupin superfamily)